MMDTSLHVEESFHLWTHLLNYQQNDHQINEEHLTNFVGHF